MTEKSLSYRPEIDGLRGIAVAAVILFHAAVPGFSGGFVGVDVFFVISGYLIGRILLSGEEGRLAGLATFYKRRALRILPALALVLVATLVAGSVLLTPTSLRSLAASAFAASLFYSNVHFWRDISYFAPQADLVPLLHTWSLSVEEQLYIVFPLLLIAIRRSFAATVLAALAAVSLVAAIVAVQLAPQAAFFLLPFRDWEFLAGAILAAAPSLAQRLEGRSWAGGAGLALILASVVGYSADLPFPGALAIPPVLGAVLIIAAGGRSISGRLLAVAPVLFTGRISYSLYLWHLPVLVFLRHLRQEPLTAPWLLAGIAASYGLAVMSWRYVEQPFRGRRFRAVPAFRVLAASALTLLVLASASRLLWRSDRTLQALYGTGDASPLLLDRELQAWFVAHCLSDDGPRDVPACRLGEAGRPADFVLWGDSHAEALAPAFDGAAREKGRSGLQLGAWNCPPVPDLATDRNPACIAVNKAALATILSHPDVKDVFLGSYWTGNLTGKRIGGEAYSRLGRADLMSAGTGGEGSNEAALSRGLSSLTEQLSSAGKRVWLVGPVAEQRFQVPQAVLLERRGLASFAPRAVGDPWWSREAGAQTFLATLAAKTGARAIDLAPALCNGGACIYERDGRAIYRDEAHLTREGTSLLIPMFAEAL
jgi:peptidoglycan/LPS O-acetylase OafA/YrhL